MPLFDYLCKACGRTCEVLVTGSEQPHCPECGSKRLEKQLSTFNAGRSAGAGLSALPCASGGCPSAGRGCTGACPHAF